MSNGVTSITKGPAPPASTQNAASRLKHELMADALERMLDKGNEKPIAPGNPRVLLAVANHAHSLGWERAKVLQRRMFEAAAGSGLEMKFAFYAEDDDEGVRRCRITSRWINDFEDMAAVMSRAECNCGCYVHIRSVLQQAVKENTNRLMRAVIIVGDAFHDDQDSLDGAALAVNQLRRDGTRVFLIQQGNDPITARKLQYLNRVSGAAHFRFDPGAQQQQLAEMLQAVSAYAAGGKDTVKVTSGQASILLLEYLKQQPMPPIIEKPERVLVARTVGEKPPIDF